MVSVECNCLLVSAYNAPQASVVGKRIGRLKWSPGSSKTVEGSVSFTGSAVAASWVLRALGVVESFSVGS